MTASLPCPRARLVDRHFALRIRPAEERALREHLPDCPGCRERYASQLAMASIDPRGPASRERLAVGLGLRRRRIELAPLLVAATACAVIATVIAVRGGGPGDPGYARRGSSASRVFVYRVPPGEEPSIVGQQITSGDELAFAYENAAGRLRLLLFGVDEHRHVYWYHPAWVEEGGAPVALPISTAPGVHELPEAIGHVYDGSELVLYAVFTDEPLSVQEVERRIGEGGPGEPLAGVAIEDQQRMRLGVTR